MEINKLYKYKSRLVLGLLICCVLGELLMQTALRARFGFFFSPLLHFLFAIGSGAFLLRFSLRSNMFVAENAEYSVFNNSKIGGWGYLRIGFFVLFAFVLMPVLYQLFKSHPIDMMNPSVSGSDVIPQVMFFVTRAIDGQFPYTPITAPLWGYVLTPTYMPFQWIPYIPAALFHFDYRWIPFSVLLLTIIGFMFRIEKADLSGKQKWIIGFLPIILLGVYYKYNLDESINTVEVLVAAYYLLFGMSFTFKKPFLLVWALLLCLLSRYSLVLWLPLFTLVYFYNNGMKSTLVIVFGVFLGILIFYGPFLYRDPEIFKKGYDYYTLATAGEWSVHSWQPPNSYPPHLERGLGFAIFFYKIFGGNIELGIHWIRLTHLVAIFLFTAGAGIWFWFNRRRIDTVIFLIATLKIYLAIFYGFIQIPYSYLYILPLLFDLPVVFFAFIGRNRLRQLQQSNMPRKKSL